MGANDVRAANCAEIAGARGAEGGGEDSRERDVV